MAAPNPWTLNSATDHLIHNGLIFEGHSYWYAPESIVPTDRDIEAVIFLARNGFCEPTIFMDIPPLNRRH
jgi:hypothetical protein